MGKLLFINTSLGQGGSERVMALLASGLAERGEDVTMLLVREGKQSSYPVSGRLKTEQLHYGTKNKLLILPKRFRQVRRVIRREKPDAVVSFMWDINAFTLLACAGLPVRVIVSERANPGAAASRRLIRRFTERVLYRLADRVVLQTEYVRRFFPEAVQRKATVIPNPVSEAMPEPLEGPRRREVVSAGRMTGQKNFPMLLRAFAAFRGTHPDWTLSLYGEGPERPALEKLCKELGLDGAVSMPGFSEQLSDRMRPAGIYASSSDFEGISNVMLEALAMGLPSVCTDCPVGGASLAIRDGENGLLVPVGDDKALAEALCRLADDRALAERLSREAPKIRDTFSLDRICALWKEACGIAKEA